MNALKFDNQLKTILPNAGVSFRIQPAVVDRIELKIPRDIDFQDAINRLRDFCNEENYTIETDYDTDENLLFDSIDLVRIKYVQPIPEFVYHVTPICRVESIRNNGIEVTNAENSLSDFPDTLGRLHTSRALNYTKGLGDSAAWWQNHLQINLDCKFMILKIATKHIPYDAGIYEDTRSSWGIIIDNVPPIRQFVEVPEEDILPLNACEMMTSSDFTPRIQRMRARGIIKKCC